MVSEPVQAQQASHAIHAHGGIRRSKMIPSANNEAPMSRSVTHVAKVPINTHSRVRPQRKVKTESSRPPMWSVSEGKQSAGVRESTKPSPLPSTRGLNEIAVKKGSADDRLTSSQMPAAMETLSSSASQWPLRERRVTSVPGGPEITLMRSVVQAPARAPDKSLAARAENLLSSGSKAALQPR